MPSACETPVISKDWREKEEVGKLVPVFRASLWCFRLGSDGSEKQIPVFPRRYFRPFPIARPSSLDRKALARRKVGARSSGKRGKKARASDPSEGCERPRSGRVLRACVLPSGDGPGRLCTASKSENQVYCAVRCGPISSWFASSTPSFAVLRAHRVQTKNSSLFRA